MHKIKHTCYSPQCLASPGLKTCYSPACRQLLKKPAKRTTRRTTKRKRSRPKGKNTKRKITKRKHKTVMNHAKRK